MNNSSALSKLRSMLAGDGCHVMGILNVTPDSFSDGGRFVRPGQAIDRVAEMVAQGAEVIDIGGESTRPGAPDVAQEEELQRVIPLVESVAKRFNVPISVDTSKPAVMAASVSAGASMINDVRALAAPGAVQAVAKANVPVCVMHMQGRPRTMQVNPQYGNVVTEVMQFLLERARCVEHSGVRRSDIVLDPGFGFGKSLKHNLSLLAAIATMSNHGYPLLIGVSRKSMFGQLLDRDVSERQAASVAAATIAALNGASFVRVHDVRETSDAVRLVAAMRAQTVDIKPA